MEFIPNSYLGWNYPFTARARDLAGNEATVTDVIHVDTVPSVSSFTSHSNCEVVHGIVKLSGKVDDKTSGAANGELISDGGITWQAVLTLPRFSRHKFCPTVFKIFRAEITQGRM